MKAAVIRDYGGPGRLHSEDGADPAVQPTEISIRVAAACINMVDAFERAGQTTGWRPLTFPAILGTSCRSRACRRSPKLDRRKIPDATVVPESCQLRGWY
jgi:hypothetical protein